MTTRCRQSPAKINLTLRVAGVRPDGFHELESLVAVIDLCDTVSVNQRADDRVCVQCDDPVIPCDASNSAHRAATALADATGVRRGVDIVLAKRIPAGSGLGGGSSNAATTLTLLNELWQTRLSGQELARIGASVGSDVPLFFHGPLCIVRGRGEQVERIERLLAGWVTVVLPDIHCSTPDIYRRWDESPERASRPPLTEVLSRLDQPEELMRLLFNDLETPALTAAPQLAGVFSRLETLSDGQVRMTGSGSALYRLFPGESAAASFARDVADSLGLRVLTARVRSMRDA